MQATKETAAARILETMRDVTLVGLPVVYVLGFVAWSNYAVSQSLGFLPLGAPRYLLAGVLLGLLLGTALAVDLYMHRRVAARLSMPDRPGWKARLRRRAGTEGLRFGSKAIAASAGLLVLSAAAWIGQLWVLEPLVFYLQLLAFSVIIAFSESVLEWMLHRRDREDAPPPEENREGHGGPRGDAARSTDADGPYGRTGRSTWETAVFSVPMWTLVALSLFSLTVLPAVHPEFGGAMPRQALLDVDADAIPREMHIVLFEDFANASGPTRSVPLTILYADDSNFLFRAPGFDRRTDPVFELDRRAVVSVTWLE